MRIAVTYENGNVYGHFGHTQAFKLYEYVNGNLVDSKVVPANGSGHGALAGFLADFQIDCLICGGIGPGAQMALAEWGIKVYAGCTGSADERAAELVAGKLSYVSEATCDHHHGDEGHACGNHGCGSHSCH